MFKKIKEKWLDFIKRIGEENKSNYGDGGINCCELKDANEPKR